MGFCDFARFGVNLWVGAERESKGAGQAKAVQ